MYAVGAITPTASLLHIVPSWVRASFSVVSAPLTSIRSLHQRAAALSGVVSVYQMAVLGVLLCYRHCGRGCARHPHSNRVVLPPFHKRRTYTNAPNTRRVFVLCRILVRVCQRHVRHLPRWSGVRVLRGVYRQRVRRGRPFSAPDAVAVSDQLCHSSGCLHTRCSSHASATYTVRA